MNFEPGRIFDNLLSGKQVPDSFNKSIIILNLKGPS